MRYRTRIRNNIKLGSLVTLNTLTLSTNKITSFIEGVHTIATISGKTTGSSLSISGSSLFSLNGNNLQVNMTAIQYALGGSYSITITETLIGSFNSPKINNFTIEVLPNLQAVVNSAVMDVDLTFNSYLGSGTLLKNLVETPADGALQTDYDMQLGDGVTSTTYPQFITDNGNKHLLFDGNDYISLLGNNTEFLNAIHKSNGNLPFTFVLIFKKLIDSASDQYLFATRLSSNNIGLSIYLNSSEAIRVSQRGDNSNTIYAIPTTPIILTQGYLSVGISAPTIPPQNLSYRLNTPTETLDNFAFNATNVDATNKLKLFDMAGGTQPVDNLTEIVAWSMFNKRLTNAEMLLVLKEYSARHNFVYEGTA